MRTMSGTILQNLSTKKLVILVSLLFLSLIICFLGSSLKSPKPATPQKFSVTACVDDNHLNSTNKWFYNRGQGKCKPIPADLSLLNNDFNPNTIVFIFQMPYANLDYSRWQQNLLGILQIDFIHSNQNDLTPATKILMDLKLGYRNKYDKENDWKLYAYSLEERYIHCSLDQDVKKDGSLYACSFMNLFELGSLYHDYYLLNMRLPVDSTMKINIHYKQITDMSLIVIHSNGGFTQIWLSLKTIFFPIVIALVMWFWRRVNMLPRSPVLLEYMLIYLGIALAFLDVPLEYLTLFYNLPFMLLLSDIRQGVFYASLLSFWLIFAGEHMLVQDSGETNTLRRYWKHLSAVVIACLALLVFDLCERGIKLLNPFYTIWVSPTGTNIALGFIVIAALSAITYFVFLSYMVWKVFCNIRIKRSILPSMTAARRLHYEGIIYRFNFLMAVTLVCATVTIASFFLGQFYDGRWQINENIELEITSAFFIGVFSLWNIYIFALLILYAPSHKQWPPNSTNNYNSSNDTEDLELRKLTNVRPSLDIASLAALVRKSQIE